MIVVNYLFVIIDLNVGVVYVKDECLEKLVIIYKFGKIILMIIEFIDIVGLVKGVLSGEGLGN